MKQRKIVIASLVMVVVLMQAVVSVSASSKTLEEIQAQLQENQEKKNEVSQQQKEAKDKVDSLEKEADALGDTYHTLNKQLKTVSNEITSTENAISSTKNRMKELEGDLQEAKTQQQIQYESMKKRIQYIYETGTDSMLVSFLSCGSMAEFIKRAEYISMMTEYDRQMMEEYADLQSSISHKTKQLDVKSQELASYQQTLSQKQGELDTLVDNAQNQYDDKNSQVSAAKMTEEEFQEKLREIDASSKSLEAEYAKIQADLAKQLAQEEAASGQAPEDTTGAYSGYSDSDLKLMAAIIQAESDGESYEGKLAVGSVVMNRVKSSKFPNTISGVIYQDRQFEPVRNGKLALILEKGPNDTCKQAAKQVLDGHRSGDWLFFMTQYWADYYGITGYVMIGNHAFFRVWGDNVQ